MHDTFFSLLTDLAHWEFELFLMLIFDGVIGMAALPFLRKHWKHHADRDERDVAEQVGEILSIDEAKTASLPTDPEYMMLKDGICPSCQSEFGAPPNQYGGLHCGTCGSTYVIEPPTKA